MTRLSETYNLQVINPTLSKQWHPTKNTDLKPKDVAPKSNKNVWWLCSKGHEWEATIDSRSRGQGCPYCAGKKICIDNCLETINPELAKEWHPTKNGKFTPKDVTANSNKKVWWICSRNHQWKTSIYHRNKGSRCPYCSGNKVCIDNCLKTNNPELAKEWHPTKNGNLTPEDLTPKSNKKVWWICKRNHAWEATVKNRSNGSSCPFCNSATSELEIRIYTEMKYIFKNVKHRKKNFGLECDVYVPKLNLGFEIDGLYWHKDKFLKDIEKSEIFEKNNIKLLRIREKGLKKTSSNDIFYSTGDSPLFIITKVLKKILKLPNVEDPAKNLIKKYLGLGQLQNESEFNRLIYMLPSPLPGNSLGDKNKVLSKEWHNIKNKPLTPYDVYPNSFKKVWWVCEKGQHEWRSRISDRFSKDVGCPYCAGKRVDTDNCLQTINPKLAKEWHPTKNGELTPKNVTANSNKKVWWICSRNHEWEATVDKRNIGRGCPYCARSERNKNRKLTIDEMQQIAKEKDGKCLSTEYINIHTHLLWECSNGHKWKAIPKSVKRGTWCPICGRIKASQTKKQRNVS
jgi:hypothetical protein